MVQTQQQVWRFGWMYAIMGVIAVIGGVYSVNTRIKGMMPYFLTLDETPFADSQEQTRLQELADLQKLDSDSDTLSDFDEQYVYYTSSYLADTDSDGVADNVEVSSSTDPTCAEGQICNQIRALTDTANTASVDTTAAGSELDVLSGDEITPEAVKAELEKMGIPQSSFANVSDKDLMDVYKSVASQYPTQATGDTSLTYDPNEDVSVDEISANQVPDDTDLTYDTSEAPDGSFAGFTSVEDFKQLDVSQVRSLLLQSGVSGEELDTLGDEDLMALYTKVLEEQLTPAEVQQ